MAKVQAFSSVSVVDLTDVGVINLYCTSNQPTSVIYDPNQNLYIPNWATSNLTITPVISYNGRNLPLTATGLTITFTRKEGSGTATALQDGETVTNGILTVTANKLSSITSGLLTYICTITYTDPKTSIPITTETAMSYSLISRATDLKMATIMGESVFLYDSSRSIVGSNQITLTADLTNVSITKWKYKKADGSFVNYPTTSGINTTNTGMNLVVDESEANIWINGKTAVIKLETSDNTVYDLHEIIKVYDGAPGQETISTVLSNENHYLPCTSDGTVRSWAGAATDVRIFEGGTDVTNQWTITVQNGTGLTGSYDPSTYTYTPSNLTQLSSYADFICTRQGYSNITKRYTITKLTAGADGEDAVIYEVVPDYYTINIKRDGTLTPLSVKFNAYSKIGNSPTKTAYMGRFIISESSDGGNTYTTTYTSGSNESQKIYTPSANTIDSIRCVLYQAGSTTTEVDSQSVVITRDGLTGEDGNDGEDGLAMGLSNYSDVIPCGTDGTAYVTRDFSIPFFAYKGVNRVPVTATVGTLPNGVTITSNVGGTSSSSGLLILTVSAGATLGNTSLLSGDITITLSADSRSSDYKYSWTKSIQAKNGENSVILQLYSEDGGNVAVGRNTVIKTSLISGSSTVTPTAVQWLEFVNGSYRTITGQTGTSITITESMVTDQMLLKCIATYNGHNYEAYYAVDDITDPYTAYTYSTIREFKNNQGYGAIYTRVYQNGVEVDPIRSTMFSSTPPSSPSVGDFYYHLDPVLKTCVLKKYLDGSWQNATETDNFTYKYYRMDSQGTPLDTTVAYKDTRCFYVDPSIINGRMQFFCEISD